MFLTKKGSNLNFLHNKYECYIWFFSTFKWTTTKLFIVPRYPDTLGVSDVFAALQSLPTADFLTNKFLGRPEGLPSLAMDRWPPDDKQWPPDDIQWPSDDIQWPPDDIQWPSDDIQWPPDDIQWPSDDIQWPPDDIQWPSDDIQWPPDDIQWPSDEVQMTIGWPTVAYWMTWIVIGNYT